MPLRTERNLPTSSNHWNPTTGNNGSWRLGMGTESDTTLHPAWPPNPPDCCATAALRPPGGWKTPRKVDLLCPTGYPRAFDPLCSHIFALLDFAWFCPRDPSSPSSNHPRPPYLLGESEPVRCSQRRIFLANQINWDVRRCLHWTTIFAACLSAGWKGSNVVAPSTASHTSSTNKTLQAGGLWWVWGCFNQDLKMLCSMSATWSQLQNWCFSLGPAFQSHAAPSAPWSKNAVTTVRWKALARQGGENLQVVNQKQPLLKSQEHHLRQDVQNVEVYFRRVCLCNIRSCFASSTYFQALFVLQYIPLEEQKISRESDAVSFLALGYLVYGSWLSRDHGFQVSEELSFTSVLVNGD